MEIKVFNVKNESLNQFFREFGVGQELPTGQRDSISRHVSPYHLMKNTIYLKRHSIPQGQVRFELEDYASGSGSKLANIYTYAVTPYDDVSVKLDLVDYEVKLIERKIENC